MTAKVPPHDSEAERAVLGCILLNPAVFDDVVLVLGTDPDVFYAPEHKAVWQVMLSLSGSGQAIDAVTVRGGLPDPFQPGGVLIAGLTSAIPTSVNAPHYAALVADAAIRRNLADAAARIYHEAMAADTAGPVVDSAEREMFRITAAKWRGAEVRHVREVLPKVVERLTDIAEGRRDADGVMLGLKPLDDILGGFQDGDLIFVAARPSVGKSAMALNIAHHAAMRQNVPVLIFSCEMAASQLAERMLSIEGLNVKQVKARVASKAVPWLMDNARRRIEPIPLYLDDTPRISMAAIRSKARRFRSEHGHCMVMIDYLQILDLGRAGRNITRDQVIGQATGELKALARELEIPVVVLCQVGRAGDAENDPFRVMAHLRESGNIEQDADVVMILTKLGAKEAKTFDQKHGEGKSQSVVKACVAKHRNGETGIVPLHFDKPFQRFQVPARDTDVRAPEPEPETEPEPEPEPIHDAEPFDEFGSQQDEEEELY